MPQRILKGTGRISCSSVILSHSITCSGDTSTLDLKIYTLGYQGVDVDLYVAKLKEAGVGIVADVRETPWSHKRGFCKNPEVRIVEGWHRLRSRQISRQSQRESSDSTRPSRVPPTLPSLPR